jgi:hypothetical protein
MLKVNYIIVPEGQHKNKNKNKTEIPAPLRVI